MAALLLAGGCASNSYRVNIDSITKPQAGQAQSYTLRSKDPRLGDENLRYHEAAELVKTALSGKGLYEAPSEDKADMIVELDYGLDTPRAHTELVRTPIYAQVGGGVRYDTVTVPDGKGNQVMRNVAVYDPPRTELVGYGEVPQQVMIYEKHLSITARENKAASEGRPPSELWSVRVSAEDESKDLRKYLPIMASATIDYIGKDSVSEKSVKVRGDSPGVEFVRRGMPESTTLAVQAKTNSKG
jgi:hypothetical protein